MSSYDALKKNIYGPYPDERIFRPSVLGQRRVFHRMESVRVEEDKRLTGLDHIEYIASPHPRKLGNVSFFGIVQVDRLDQLSAIGKQWLLEDVMMADAKNRGRLTGVGVRNMNLTLERLYEQHDFRLRVWVKGDKNVAATFMSSDKFPNSLIFRSTHGIYYEVESMQVQTYQMSKNYFERWRMHHLIREIVSSDPGIPVEDRRIAWLVAKVIEHHQTNSLNFCAIHHPRDKKQDKVDKHGRMVTSPAARALRHIPRAEIAHIFATHGEWFLAQSLLETGDPLVNLEEWHRFCVAVRREPKKWGLARMDSKDLNLEKFGGDRWQQKIDTLTKRSTSTKTPIVTPSLSLKKAVYDADFSPESTPSPSDSEYQSEPHVKCDVIDLIPRYCFARPELAPGSFVWHCPDNQCKYTIDFLRPTANTTRGMPREVVLAFETLQEDRSWTMSQPVVQEIFYRMVSHHYDFGHLRPLGILVHRKDRKVVLETTIRRRSEIQGIKEEETNSIPTLGQQPVAKRHRRRR